MSTDVCTSLPAVRARLRDLARRHRLPADLRARLVLAVADCVRPPVSAGRPVVLESRIEGGGEGTGLLVVTARAAGSGTVLEPPAFPLAGEAVPGTGAVRWRLPFGPEPASASAASPEAAAVTAAGAGTAHGRGSAGRSAGLLPGQAARDGHPARDAHRAPDGDPAPDGDEAAEEELRAVLARADALAADHLRLKDEIAETNSGVLALYVQLEERDEQLRTAHGKILRELEDALRPVAPTAHGLELGVHYAPAGADAPTGGDLYDWFVRPDGTLHITVVDALGHGVTSTRGALNVTHVVRTLVLEGHPAETVVRRTAELLQPFDPELMATLVLARLDPATGELRLANGSHPPPLLLRADGTARYLEAAGRGVGYPLAGSDVLLTERLEPEDLLVLYTDGLTESRRDPLEGERRLVQAVRRHAGKRADDLAGAVADEMHTVVLHPDDTLVLTVRLPRE